MARPEPACNWGTCVARKSDRELGTSMCVDCGKTLILKEGRWWTWDAVDRPIDDREPQGEIDD